MRRLLHEVVERFKGTLSLSGRYFWEPIFINLTIACPWVYQYQSEHHVKRILNFFLKSDMYVLHRINFINSNITTIPYFHVYWLL